MSTVGWIVLIVVVLALLALIALLAGKKRKQKRLHLAEQHRAGAHEELRDLQHQRADAEAAEARAQAAKAEAEKAELAAREARQAEQMQHARAEDKIREADRLDPRVDHKSDEYNPGYDRVTPQQQGGSHASGETGTRPGTAPVTEGTTHPNQGGEHRA